VWIDSNPLAIALGREVYGFPKEEGRIRLSPGSELPERITLDAFAARNLGRSTRWSWIRLLDLSAQNGTAVPNYLSDTFERHNGTGFFDIVEFWRDIADTALSEAMDGIEGRRYRIRPRFPLRVASDLARMQFPLVFLKQFYDAEGRGRACYQAIIEAPLSASNVHGSLLKKWELTRRLSESHPLGQDLGLREVDEPVVAYKVTCNLRTGAGVELWRAR
jgi:hypothetical protein